MSEADVPTISEAIMGIMVGITPILEAATGYREQCQKQGFSETAAEQMAVTLHMALVSKAILG